MTEKAGWSVTQTTWENGIGPKRVSPASTGLGGVESLLHASAERFRSFVTACSEVLYRMNPDWSEMVELASQGFLVNTDEPSGLWLEKYIHPDDRPYVRAVIDRAIANKSLFELAHRIKRADRS